MGISRHAFISFCAILTAGILWSYSEFIKYFNNGDDLRLKISQLSRSLELSQIQNALLDYQLKDLQQTSLSLIPEIKVNQNWALLNLQTSLRSPASLPKLDLSAGLFSQAQTAFQNQKFQDAVEIFIKLKESYPLSKHLVETHFYLAESYFKLNNFKACSEVVDTMVEQFPNHVLTGFILLRLGQISEITNQPDVAREIYETVFEQFNVPDLKKQANTLLSNLDGGNSK